MRIDGLDGVRALAVVAVMLSHLSIPALAGGGNGVLVFFVLSGFLITTLLMRERDEFASMNVVNFYARRALRLLPGALLVITATVLAVRVGGAPAAAASLDAVLASVFYVANWMWFAAGTGPDVLGYLGHFWSLSVEEQFYLVWPLTLVALARLREVSLAVVLAVTCGGVLAGRLLIIRDATDGHLLFGTHLIVDQLLLGALLAVCLRLYPAEVARVTRALFWPAVAGLLLLSAFLSTTATGSRGLLGVTVAPSLVAVSAAMVIGRLVTAQDALATRVLSWPPLAYLGRISYGIYLWHILVMVLVAQVVQDTWLVVVGTLVGTVAVASASYFWWERPFLRIKERFLPAVGRGGGVEPDGTRGTAQPTTAAGPANA